MMTEGWGGTRSEGFGGHVDDDLNAARGIVNAAALSLPLWFLIASCLIVWFA